MSRDIFVQCSLEANEIFQKNPETLHVDMLICTIELGNSTRTYKIIGIDQTAKTVDLVLPDLVKQTVPMSSLYSPHMALQLFENLL